MNDAESWLEIVIKHKASLTGHVWQLATSNSPALV